MATNARSLGVGMNARDEHGLVHEVEKFPELSPTYEYQLEKAGFTWCMQLFTWADGPRWHPPSDQVEGRLEQTSDPPTCLYCVIHPTEFI